MMRMYMVVQVAMEAMNQMPMELQNAVYTDKTTKVTADEKGTEVHFIFSRATAEAAEWLLDHVGATPNE